MASTPSTTAPEFTPSSSTQTHAELSPLEQEVLDEYARLLGNLNNVRLLPLLFIVAFILFYIQLTRRLRPR